MSLGWAAEAAPAGGMDAVQKLIEQRMQMARDAEMVRSNMAREQLQRDTTAENAAYRRDSFGAQQATRDAGIVDKQADAFSADTPVGPSDQAKWQKAGMGGLLRTRPLDATALPAASVPTMTGGLQSPSGSPQVDAMSPAAQVPDTPVPGKPGDMLSIPTEKNRLTQAGIDERAHASQDAIEGRATEARTRQGEREDMARLTASLRTGTGEKSRMDHSYETQTKRLDALEKPLADQAERIGRLRATIEQNSPQADALIAPELLTAMAGGAGSGLRMNEAEIERIVGGRTQWESLKAVLGAWGGDASKPFAVTPEQRVQMRALIKAVAARGQKRLQILDDARSHLLDAADVVGHRKIIDAAKKALNADSDSGSTTDATHAPMVKGGWNYEWKDGRYQATTQVQP